MHVEQAGFEKQQDLLQGRLQPWPTDGPIMSKNKKRKLKKKQQIKKKREAGVPARAPGGSFTYQPAGGSSEQEAAPQSDEEVADASWEDAGVTRQGHAGEEAGKGTSEKADGLLNFLKSTQEIYFYDGMLLSVFLLNTGIHLFGKISKYSKIFKYLKCKTLKYSLFIRNH